MQAGKPQANRQTGRRADGQTGRRDNGKTQGKQLKTRPIYYRRHGLYNSEHLFIHDAWLIFCIRLSRDVSVGNLRVCCYLACRLLFMCKVLLSSCVVVLRTAVRRQRGVCIPSKSIQPFVRLSTAAVRRLVANSFACASPRVGCESKTKLYACMHIYIVCVCV